MKILVIGATGTIGREVVKRLAEEYDVLLGSRTTAGLAIDITSPASIRAYFEATGPVDGVVCAAGDARFGPMDSMTDEDYEVGLRSHADGPSERHADRHRVHSGRRLDHTHERHQGPGPDRRHDIDQPGECRHRGLRPRCRPGAAARHPHQRRFPARGRSRRSRASAWTRPGACPRRASRSATWRASRERYGNGHRRGLAP